MLNVDADRFLRIQTGAVSLAERLDRTIGQCLSAGTRNLFFVGSGGAGILMEPAAALLQDRSSLPVHVRRPAELVATGSVHLCPDSLVVIPSLSGTTPESVEVLEFAHARGATVLSLTGHAGTPVADGADHSFVNAAEDDTSSESFYLQSLILALSVMHHRGEIKDWSEVIEQLQQMPRLLLEVKQQVEPESHRLATALSERDYHVFTGAGSTWPEAHYYAMCILEEMQWIRTRPVHAADFFHGTLELVEPGVSVVLFKGEDAARPLVERVEKFLPSVTEPATVLDTADFELPGLDRGTRALVSPVVLATVLERVSAHLEVIRDHPLTTRRYYKRMPY
jgi:fructoselysine-6-phosphate deglycase